MDVRKHLWECSHPYYCNDGNYLEAGHVREWKSLDDFLAEFAAADLDYNAIFRFDWREGDDETSNFNGDVNYRNGSLHVYWIGQRKGYFFVSIVQVCRADETRVIEFLRPRFEYLMRLWEPLSTISP